MPHDSIYQYPSFGKRERRYVLEFAEFEVCGSFFVAGGLLAGAGGRLRRRHDYGCAMDVGEIVSKVVWNLLFVRGFENECIVC